MKTLTTHPSLSSILIISISIYIYGATGNLFDSPVMDTDRDEVRMGTFYVMTGSFFFPRSSGGISTATGKSPCYPDEPMEVVQDTSDPGLPLQFFAVKAPFNAKNTVINTTSRVIIAFKASPTCTEPTPTAWYLQDDASLAKSKVTVGRWSSEADKTWFKLEAVVPLLPFYKLVYCTSEDKCGDLAILRDDFDSSKRRLVIPLTGSTTSDKSFYVTLSKASNNNLRIRKLPA